MVKSMCQGGFLNKSETEEWDFLEKLAEKTLQWEITKDESLEARINSYREEFMRWQTPLTLT